MKRFRKSAVALLLLWFAVAAAGQDPTIRGTTAVDRDKLVVLSIDAPAESAVTWRITPSAGVTKAPNQPAGQLVFNGPPGTYQVDTLVIDWKNRTVKEASETVVIGGKTTPPVTDPPTNPPAGKLFFVIVREQQATQQFLDAMRLGAWKELTAAGHAFKDYTVGTVPAGVTIPSGQALPFVLTLTSEAGGWKQAAGVSKFPTTDDGVRQLLKGGAP